MHCMSGSNHSSGKSTLLLSRVFLSMGSLSLSLYLSSSIPSSRSDNISRLGNCVFEWSYTAGWNLQSDTENAFPSAAVRLSIHTVPQQSGLATPPALLPAMRFLQTRLLFVYRI